MAELSRALHFGHKSGDGQFLSLLEEEGVYMDQNFILGQEFESFSQKGPVIESGIYQYSQHSSHTQTHIQSRKILSGNYLPNPEWNCPCS